MTGRWGVAGMAFCVMAGTAVGAAGVWETKAFNTWTDAELKTVLTDSPWAGKAGISYVKTNGASSQPIEDVGVVMWSSALPMRQADVREQIAPGTPIPEQVAKALGQSWDKYVIAIKVSGGTNSSSYARGAAASLAETFLERDGKPPIAAARSEGRMLDKDGKVVPMPAAPAPGAPRGGGAPGGPPAATPNNGPMLRVQGGAPGGGGRGGFGGFGGATVRGGSTLLIFEFPKTDPITLADKEVEFVSKLCGPSFGRGGAGQACQYNVKKKFKLKDMVLKGDLAL